MTIRKRSVLNQIHEIPAWLDGNPHLKSGYRKTNYPFTYYLFSFFNLHNETLNIWTHFLGAVFFIICGMFISNILLPNERLSTLNNLAKNNPLESPKINETISDVHNLLNNQMLSLNNESNSVLIMKLHMMEHEIKNYSINILTKIKTEGDMIASRLNKNSGHVQKAITKLKTLLTQSFDHSNYDQPIHTGTLKECLHPKTLEALLKVVPSEIEIYPIIVFIIGAVLCLGLSAIFHWFHPLNEKVCKILLKLDYSGISLLNFGSSFSIFYYYFYCSPAILFVSSSFIFAACFSVFLVSLTNWIDYPENKKLKGFMYVALGASNLIPAVMIVYMVFSASELNDYIPVGTEFVICWMMCLTYFVGFLFYFLKIPEKYVAHKFDIWMNSHTIWHLFVFLAAVENLFILVCLYEKRRHLDCYIC